MKKLTILLCSFMGVSSLSGCSSIDVFEGRTFWENKTDAHVVNNNKSSENSLISDDLKNKETSISLLKHQVDFYPEWFNLSNLGTEENSVWKKININTSKSFSANLSDYGIPTLWIHDLRVSDYIDLSTNNENQTVWVEQNEDKSFLSLYTIISSKTSYYVEIKKSGPVMTSGLRLPVRLGTVELIPETKTDDLSDIQKSAVSLFVSEITKDINHEQKVIVNKGETTLNFEYTQIDENKFGGISLLPSVSRFEDYIMTFKPN